MNRTILLTLALLILGGGAWYALRWRDQNAQSSALRPDMDFAVSDTASIGRIFFANRNNQTVLLERGEDNIWMYNKTFRARQSAVQMLQEMFKQVKVWYIPPEAAENNMVKSIASEGIKVEIYDRSNKKLKTFYVGGVTNDERGTYLMMEGSERPYVVHMPSMVGGLRARFFFGDDQWKDRTVFAEQPEKIESVSVEYPKNKSESFRLTKLERGEYDVTPFYSATPAKKVPRKKGVAEGYLLQFDGLYAEAIRNSYELKDSIRSLVPFAIVTLKNNDGTEKKVSFWPVEMGEDPTTKQEFVVRYLADCSWGDLMLVQQYSFGKIFLGYSSFFEGRDVDTPRFRR